MWAFHRYFLRYLFTGKTRQGILFLALVGLFLSAFALTVIQGVMGGLQKGLVDRSKAHGGHGLVLFTEAEARGREPQLLAEARQRGLHPVRELETELLIRHGNYVAPLILHGVDLKTDPPPFLKHKDVSGLILGSELGQRLKVTFLSDVRLITPASTEALMGEVPRELGASVSDFLLSDVTEIDMTHGWTRLSLVQNLLRERHVNRWRFFDGQEFARAQAWLEGEPGLLIRSWEEQNSTLVWALNLETRVMLALFVGMTFLVALQITTGLSLLFARIRPDLASFWILGLSMERIQRLCLGFIVQLSTATCLFGVAVGSLALWLLERFGHEAMPDIFVERGLPVQFSVVSLALAFGIPCLIAGAFSLVSFAQFRKENRTFIHLIRGSGQAV